MPKDSSSTKAIAQRVVIGVASAAVAMQESGALPAEISLPILAGTTLFSTLLPSLFRRKKKVQVSQ